jgi:hypothetical protein
MHWSNEDCERIPRAAIDRLERLYGRESNYFRVNVLGEFPVEDADTFIPLHLVEQAFERDALVDESRPLQVGCDPAYMGKDTTAIVQRQGGVVGPFRRYKNQDTVQTAKFLQTHYLETSAVSYCIDSNGFGAGVYDNSVEFGLPAYPVNSSTNARDVNKFHRTRDELLWGIREPFFEGRISFVFDDEDISPEMAARIKEELKEEIMSIKWFFDSQGRIQFESKKEHKRRLGRSPDLLDALCLSYYLDDETFVEEQDEEEWMNKSQWSSYGAGSWMST